MGRATSFDGRHRPRATDHLIIDAFSQLSHTVCVRETQLSVPRLDKWGDSFSSVPIMKSVVYTQVSLVRRHE